MAIKNGQHFQNSLEFKVYFSLIIVAIIPLLIYILSNIMSVKKNFTIIEKESVKQQTERAKNIFNNTASYIEKVAKDCGIWDDTYEKIQEKDIPWLKENFSEWIPDNYNIDLLIVANKNKKILDQYGVKNGNVLELFNDNNIHKVLNDTYDKEVNEYPHGLKIYNGELYLLGICPILTNNYEGPSQGIIIIGKKISSELLTDIENKHNYKIIVSFNDNIISANNEHRNAVTYLNIFQNNLNNDVIIQENSIIIGRIPINDISNTHLGHIYTINSRKMFLSFHKSIYKNVYITLIISLLIIVILSIYLKKKILSPIKNLESAINHMEKNNELQSIYIEGPNEIINLSLSFNKMVNTLSMEKNENKTLKSLCITDGLTCLYNHKYFYNYCHEKISQDCSNMTILFCDIDNFKVINDLKGHLIGDMILKGIADIMKETSDKTGVVFRYGGEEFAVVLNNLTSEQAYNIAEEIRINICNSSLLRKYCDGLPVTISIGLASYPNEGLNIESIVEKADIAMYYAKQNGKNKCYIYSSEIDEVTNN